MADFQQSGKTVTMIAPVDLVDGQPILIENMFGIVAGSVSIGSQFEMHLVGVFRNLPKAVLGSDINPGARVYWDDANQDVTTTATGNTLIGVCLELATASAEVITVRLNGSF